MESGTMVARGQRNKGQFLSIGIEFSFLQDEKYLEIEWTMMQIFSTAELNI